MPRALSIYLPGWPVWLARRKHQSATDSTRLELSVWLLWTSQRGVQQVIHGCERARAAGVRPGMTLAHARALCAGVPVHDQAAAPGEEAGMLRRLAHWMLRYAPVVAPEDPDGLMLDIAGCDGLFGGEREHTRRIASALRGWGLRPRLAVAPTFACAWAVSRYGEAEMTWVAEGTIHSALSRLPVEALRVDARSLAALADVGIDRIEHLLSVPRDELAARFGAELLHRIDLADGAVSEAVRSVRPLSRYRATHAFDGPVRRLNIIEATTRELLGRLLTSLSSFHRGIRELAVELLRVGFEPQTVLLRLTYPNRDHSHLWKLLWPRLERVNLGFGVTEIVLEAARTERMKSEQTVFLREAARDHSDQLSSLGELVDRLTDRLGGEAVTRVQPAESYIPERAFVHSAVREIKRAPLRIRTVEHSINPAHRPSQLFERPEAVRMMSVVPDGPPVWLEWRGQSGEIIASIGPERIASPWWTNRATSPRDYYEIEDSHARQLWVYRDGGSGEWFVHGQWI